MVRLSTVGALALSSWLLALGGCANYRVASEFAGHTQAMTGAVREEVTQLDRLCRDQEDIYDVVAGGAAELAQVCEAQAAAARRWQAVTLDVLDLYAKTLLKMADDKHFELAQPIQATTGKLAGLNPGDGALVTAGEAAALGKVLALLADVVAQGQREQGVQRLIAVGPELVDNGQAVRRFLANDAGPWPPYQVWVRTVQGMASGSAAALAPKGPLDRGEPIRSAELRRVLGKTDAPLKQRLGTAAPVPSKLVQALDEWIAAVPLFQQHALQPDARALIERLNELRRKTADARDAIAQAH